MHVHILVRKSRGQFSCKVAPSGKGWWFRRPNHHSQLSQGHLRANADALLPLHAICGMALQKVAYEKITKECVVVPSTWSRSWPALQLSLHRIMVFLAQESYRL